MADEIYKKIKKFYDEVFITLFLASELDSEEVDSDDDDS